MQNSENKRELFRLIAKYVESTINPSEGKQVICTMDEGVVACPSSIPTENINPCSHEEVDTRIILHAKDAAVHG